MKCPGFSVSPVSGSQGRKSGASSVSSDVSSSSSKWKSTFSPISDPKPTPPDLRQSGSPFCGGVSCGPDSDSEQKPQKRADRDRSEHFGNAKPFPGLDKGRESFPKQKAREWELKAMGSLTSQNLFISAAAGGGLLCGKAGRATAVSSASSVGPYYPLSGNSVLQSLFGAQTPNPATGGPPRLVNGHSVLGSFSSAGLAGGAAGGEQFLVFSLFFFCYSGEFYLSRQFAGP